jgi:DNA-binding NarL/FixJ family response regulator
VSIRVLLADDQPMVRTGFRMILEAEPDIDVVAEVGDGVEALQAARELNPDVCLLDIRMPKIDGLEVTRRLAGPRVLNPTRVVVVTTFDLDEYVHAALSGGACGFLLKDAGPALLVEAVRAAARGDALISPQITLRLLHHFSQPRSGAPAQPTEPLTAREEDVLRAVARGLTNAEVAAELFITLSTVKTHLGAIHAKLGVRNRVEVAAWAYRTGRMSD